MRLSAVSAWLSAISRIMQLIQYLFCAFPSLIQQGRILRVTNIGGRAGSVHDHGTAVAAVSTVVVIVVTVILFLRRG